MKKFKKLFVAITLMGVFVIATSTVKAGLLVSDFTGGNAETPCTEKKDDSKVEWGVIVNGLTGVIVNGLTGVILNGYTGVIINDVVEEDINCGVIVNG